MSAAQFHLGWFLSNSFGVHGWRQEWGGTTARNWMSPDLHIDLARALERACFDFLLLEDSLFVPDSYGSSRAFYLERALRVPKNDPLPLVPLLAQATTRLGLVPTISTSFYPPYLLARLMATLDMLSDGRTGCNFVTSTSARAAQNFGFDDHIEHDLRYEMADEFVEVTRKLWSSWDADALMPEEEDIFADARKVNSIDHMGRFFSSRGPLNTARPPQGHPVLVQAGSSEPGRSFAARHMDCVLAAFGRVEDMKAFRADMRRRVAGQGRNPDTCKVLFVASPTLGETDREAQARFERGRAWKLAHPEESLALMASLTDIDFARFDLDQPLAEMTTNGQQETLRQFLGRGRTLREISRNYTYGLEDLVGTPDSVASQMDAVMEEVGGDGFMLTGNLTRRFVAEITDGLVPALQKRGLVRTRYNFPHLRENLLEF